RGRYRYHEGPGRPVVPGAKVSPDQRNRWSEFQQVLTLATRRGLRRAEDSRRGAPRSPPDGADSRERLLVEGAALFVLTPRFSFFLPSEPGGEEGSCRVGETRSPPRTPLMRPPPSHRGSRQGLPHSQEL